MKIQLLPIAVLALLISCTNKAEVETSGIVSLERDKMLEAVVLSNPQEVEMPEMLNPANFSVVHDSLLFVTNQQNMENLAPVEMFKFDHDGSLLATYKFDRFVNSISITKDEKYLYCGSRKSVSEVPCLLRYELRQKKKRSGYTQSNENAELMIEFTPDVTGECFREVYVFCNTEESPVNIQIHGKIESK